jgi:hypothetical protein
MAAVKSALDAAGASSYTGSQNATTKKFTIYSDTVGGGNIFQLMLTDVLFTAADLLGFDDSADLTGLDTYTADEIRCHTSEWIKWDLGATSNPDAFIVIGKRSTGVNLSESAVITLEGSLTDSWGSPAYSQVIPYNENALIKLKANGADGLHSSALRYWRVTIVDRSNANGYVEFAKVYLGEQLTTTQGTVQFPFTHSHNDYSRNNRSDSGSIFSVRNDRAGSFTLDWSFLTTLEKESFDEVYQDVGISNYELKRMKGEY